MLDNQALFCCFRYLLKVFVQSKQRTSLRFGDLPLWKPLTLRKILQRFWSPLIMLCYIFFCWEEGSMMFCLVILVVGLYNFSSEDSGSSLGVLHFFFLFWFLPIWNLLFTAGCWGFLPQICCSTRFFVQKGRRWVNFDSCIRLESQYSVLHLFS